MWRGSSGSARKRSVLWAHVIPWPKTLLYPEIGLRSGVSDKLAPSRSCIALYVVIDRFRVPSCKFLYICSQLYPSNLAAHLAFDHACKHGHMQAPSNMRGTRAQILRTTTPMISKEPARKYEVPSWDSKQ